MFSLEKIEPNLKKLLKITFILFVLIFILVFITSLLYVNNINKSEFTAYAKNKAENQKFLSQEITKNCIFIINELEKENIKQRNRILDNFLIEFESNNQILLSNKINIETEEQINKIQIYYNIIHNNARQILENKKDSTLIEEIYQAEQIFTSKTTELAHSYDSEYKKKVNEFKNFVLFSNVLFVITFVSLIYVSIVPAVLENSKKTGIILEQNKELKKLVETKTKFLSVISHDLKNPFNTIIGISKILLKKHKEIDIEKREKYIESIHEISTNTYSLLENMLAWSRSHSNELKLFQEKIDLNNIINQTIEINLKTAKTKKIEIINSVVNRIYVYADKNMITLIFRNLLSNAIKFTNENGFITISAEKKYEMIEISFSDNGIGMDNETLENIFNSDNTKSLPGTRGETGTGFGLLLCKEFTEKHGGTISVDSEKHKGSIFKFTVPEFKD